MIVRLLTIVCKKLFLAKMICKLILLLSIFDDIIMIKVIYITIRNYNSKLYRSLTKKKNYILLYDVLQHK